MKTLPIVTVPKNVTIKFLPELTYSANDRFERKIQETVGRDVMRAINEWMYSF